jgi:hypothetical protein
MLPANIEENVLAANERSGPTTVGRACLSEGKAANETSSSSAPWFLSIISTSTCGADELDSEPRMAAAARLSQITVSAQFTAQRLRSKVRGVQMARHGC